MQRSKESEYFREWEEQEDTVGGPLFPVNPLPGVRWVIPSEEYAIIQLL